MPSGLFPELRDRAFDEVASILPLAAVRDAAERRQIERALKECQGLIRGPAMPVSIKR